MTPLLANLTRFALVANLVGAILLAFAFQATSSSRSFVTNPKRARRSQCAKVTIGSPSAAGWI